jgi:hypothetical protein
MVSWQIIINMSIDMFIKENIIKIPYGSDQERRHPLRAGGDQQHHREEIQAGTSRQGKGLENI